MTGHSPACCLPTMEESIDPHEFSEGWPSSSASSSYDEDVESELGEVIPDPGAMGQSWSRNSQHSSELPNWQNRLLPAPQTRSESTSSSLLRHNRNSLPVALSATRNGAPSRTLPPLDLSNFPPPTAPLPGETLHDSSSRTRDLPSSHLQLPHFSVLHDLVPISPAASRSSNDSWPGSWPSLTQSDFVDLDDDPSPPAMPSATRTKRRASRSVPSDGPSAESSAKRRKTGSGAKKTESLKKEEVEPPQVDLTHVDDDTGLNKVLQTQQEMTIKAQREAQGDQPTKLSSLQCIICLETMTDITATHCGKSYITTHRKLTCD